MTSTHKPPVFPLYIKDWESSDRVPDMDGEQETWYLRLLKKSWHSDPPASLPNDDALLRRLAKAVVKLPVNTYEFIDKEMSETAEAMLSILETCGIKADELQQLKFEKHTKKFVNERLISNLVASHADLQAAFERRWKFVVESFDVRGDRIYSKRLEEVISDSKWRKERQSDGGRDAANRRWDKYRAENKGDNKLDTSNLSENITNLENSDKSDVGDLEKDNGSVVSPDASSLSLSVSKKDLKENSLRSKRKVEREGLRLADSGFILSKELMDYALEKISRPVWFDDPKKTHADLITDFVLPDFITYWDEDKTNKAWKKDWPAAWRTWCRKAKVYGSYERNRWSGVHTTVAITSSEDTAEDLAFTESILASHEANSRYARLDVRDVYTTMKRWCVEKGKDDTPELLIEWLEHNLSEQPTPLFDTDDLQEFKDDES
jgi:hypothetical protein